MPLASGARQDFLPAPEFPPGLPWLNVSRPLTLEDLRGKAVILDFWTYGCINCLHVAEELRALEDELGNRVAIISVHSPKFDNERSLDTLRRNVLRYGLRHPVVQDEEQLLMKAYGARAWPTVAVIDLEGRYVGRLVGEGVGERLRPYLTRLLERQAGVIDERPLPLALEADAASTSGLVGPGKVTADGDRVAISDTLHHRVVVTDPAGKVLQLFGDGHPGLVDGAAADARFRSPQGLLLRDGQLYVADAGNHAIRVIDLEQGRVSTLAGTGEIGKRPRFTGEGDGRQLDLRSPWALAGDDKYLYIAMAGSHQIWRLDLTNGRLGVFAGSGREGLVDGDPAVATFSQPSGLCISGRSLYVIDAEASAVRRVSLDGGDVTTLVGTGLFDFGMKDGPFSQALLQHPADVVALGGGRLLVADAYNQALRVLDLKDETVATLWGEGAPGGGPREPLRLNEPSGLALLPEGSGVLVADTNNDRLLRFDPKTGDLSEWVLTWPTAPATRGNTRDSADQDVSVGR